MRLAVKNIHGGDAGTIQVLDDVFGAPVNLALVHQVVVGQLANARQGTADTKTRSQVTGSGRKPFPQKHTGRARQGPAGAPNMKGGGVAFGPHPRSYTQRTPKRMRRASTLGLLSEKVRTGELIVLDSLTLERPKTSEMVRVLAAIDATASVLLVADGADGLVLRAARNVPRLKMIPASLINTLDLLNHRKIIMTVDAVRKAEEVWGGVLARHKRVLIEAVAEPVAESVES